MSDQVIRVLVADDEAPFRQELASLSWHKYGCEFVGAASNGLEALEMCADSLPHVIITDIAMPVMSGLEMLRQLHHSFPQVKTVLLTCHEDFTFVKEAISLGAVDYILKRDLCEDEIVRVIEKNRTLIQREFFINSTERMKRRNLLLQYLLAHNNSTYENTGQLQQLMESIPFKPVYGQSPYFLYISSGDRRITLRLEVQSFLEQCALVSNWAPVDIDVYAVQFKSQDEQIPHSFLNELESMFRQELPFFAESFSPFLVKERPAEEINDYIKLLSNIRHWQAIRFYNPNINILTVNDYTPPQDITQSHRETLVQFLKNNMQNDAECPDIPEDWLRKQLIWPSQVKQAVVDYLLKLPGLKDNYNTLLHQILDCEDVGDFVSLLLYACCPVAESRQRIEIRKAKHIIQDELSSELTLKSVAQRVNLSPQYFGKLFNETIGVSFHQYVTIARMEQAERLLRESDLLVYEVAEKVGIPNYRYFSTLFRKITGKTPKDIRNGSTV